MAGNTGEGGDRPALPGDLRFLKWLTGALAGVMIVGLVIIVALLVTRLRPMPPEPPALPVLPDTLDLPAGLVPEAVTFGPGWIAVVAGPEILIFAPEGGAPRQRLQIALD